jgi:hypothetical protein
MISGFHPVPPHHRDSVKIFYKTRIPVRRQSGQYIHHKNPRIPVYQSVPIQKETPTKEALKLHD